MEEKNNLSKSAVNAEGKISLPAVKKTIKKEKAATKKPLVKKAMKKLKVKVSASPKTAIPANPFIVNLSRPAPPDSEQKNKLKEEPNKEIKSGSEKMGDTAKKVPIKIYRKIAYSFIFLTLGLLAIVFYFSFLSLKIILVPVKERVSNNLIFDVYDSNSPGLASGSGMAGVVKEIKASSTKTYLATGSKIIGEDVSGKVTIYNNSGKNQPLVATTRLITQDNILFRLRETVNVPAGGQVVAEIYADQPTEDIVVSPSRFTIPGLWAGLQDKIYAESEETIKYEKQAKKVITQEDIDNGMADLKKSLLEKAKSDIALGYTGYHQAIYQVDDNSIIVQVDGKLGEEREEFSITIEASIITIIFKDDEIGKLAQDKLISSLPEGKELSEFKKENTAYAINSYDIKEGMATLNASFDGQIVIKSDSQVVDRNKIVGLSRDQVKEYLNSIPEISGYDLKFSPAFIDRAPNLVDRIKVEVRK